MYLFNVFVELIKAKHSTLIFSKWVLLKIKFLMKSILLWNKSIFWKPSSYVHSNTTTITIIIYRFILHFCVIAGWCWHCKYNDIISSNNHWQNFSQRDFMFYVNKPRIWIQGFSILFSYVWNEKEIMHMILEKISTNHSNLLK